MRYQNRPRHTIAVIIMLCYLLPVFLLSAYSLIQKDIWLLFAIGLSGGIFGTCLLFLVLCRWELALRQEDKVVTSTGMRLSEQVANPSENSVLEVKTASTQHHTLSLDDSIARKLTESQMQHMQLIAEIDLKNNAIATLYEEKENLERHIQSILQECSSYKNAVQEQVQQQEALIKKCQEAFLEQQLLVENKKQQIANLESKERDLMYEIKTLLQIVKLDIGET